MKTSQNILPIFLSACLLSSLSFAQKQHANDAFKTVTTLNAKNLMRQNKKNLSALHFNHPLNIVTPKQTIKLQVAIAEQPAKMARGLMFVKQMDKHQGMLFVYKQPKKRGFWMKNTLIPLDILFINASRKIVDIQTMLPCKTSHCIHYRSKQPAQYALEINAGLAKQWGVQPEDLVIIPTGFVASFPAK